MLADPEFPPFDISLARRIERILAVATAETAFLLGYAEPSNFYRAFRRWYGRSPLQARRQLRKQGVRPDRGASGRGPGAGR